MLTVNGKPFTLNRKINDVCYWECVKLRCKYIKCTARVVTKSNQISALRGPHNHPQSSLFLIRINIDSYKRDKVVGNYFMEERDTSACMRPTLILHVLFADRFKLVVNRRGGRNLLYRGHMYSVERKYMSSVNWVCSKNSNVRQRCPARCITTSTGSIKLSHRKHNHPRAPRCSQLQFLYISICIYMLYVC